VNIYDLKVKAANKQRQDTSGIMLTKGCSTILILNLIFHLVLIEQTSQHQRMFIQVPLRMNWSSAQEYCREHYTDLATIRDEEDIDAIQSQSFPYYWYWIGLQRDKTNHDEWNWSDGDESTLTKWETIQPNDVDENEDCVTLKTVLEWHDDNCNEHHPFVCQDDLILVKENKTWEDALEHCRNLDIDPSVSDTYLNHVYDLAHIDVDNSLARKKVQDSETAEVWIGLRFLAGRWLWVNRMPLHNQLNACPEPKRRCGTMSKKGELYPLRDCLERRNFFCLKKNNWSQFE